MYSCAQPTHRCFCLYFLSCQHWQCISRAFLTIPLGCSAAKRWVEPIQQEQVKSSLFLTDFLVTQPLRKKSKGSVESFRKCFCISMLILLFCNLAWNAWARHLACSEVPPFPQWCCQIAEAHGGQETVHKVIQWFNTSIQTQSQHLLDSWFFVPTRRLIQN